MSKSWPGDLCRSGQIRHPVGGPVDMGIGGLVWVAADPGGGRLDARVSEHGAQHADSDELAQFGYKQELDRSLGSFSSFAAGFSYISILTGVFQLFGFAFLSARPGVLVVVADRLRRPAARRALLRRARRAVSRSPDRSTSGRSRSARAVRLVDGRLAAARRLDRHRGRGRRRLPGDPAPDLDLVPVRRHQGRRRPLLDAGRREERGHPRRWASSSSRRS